MSPVRLLLSLLLLAALAGPVAAKPKPKPAASSPRPAEAAPTAPTPPPPPEPPAPTLADITQATEQQVRDRLGAPDVARHDGAGGLWTYRLKGCALFVFFRSEDGQPLKVSGASAGPRRRGQAAPSVDACMAQFKEGHEDVDTSDDPIQAILDQPK